MVQWDSAPGHTAKIVQNWTEERRNMFAKIWPPNSSHFRPIQHLRDVPDKPVGSMEAPPCLLKDLKDVLPTFWCQIQAHTSRGPVESVARWFGAVLAAEVNAPRY